MDEKIKDTFRAWFFWFSGFSLPEVDRFDASFSGARISVGGSKFDAAAALILYPKFLRTTDEVAMEVGVGGQVLRNWKSEQGFQTLLKSMEYDLACSFISNLLNWDWIPMLYEGKTEPFLWNNAVLKLLIYNLKKILDRFLEPKDIGEAQKSEVLLLKGLGVSRPEVLKLPLSYFRYIGPHRMLSEMPTVNSPEHILVKILFEDPINIIGAREGLQLLVRSFQGLWGGEERPKDSDLLDEALKNYFVDLGSEMEKSLMLLKKAYQDNLSRERIKQLYVNCERLGIIASKKMSYLDYNTTMKTRIHYKKKRQKIK